MKLNWDKKDGLIPAIIQDHQSNEILMLGYMNAESLQLTQETGLVTFFSRSRQAIWQKGETSGNSLSVVEIKTDCDQDALLIRVNPKGPVCHRATPTCFDSEYEFLAELESIIESRSLNSPQKSYVYQLFNSGLDRIAQKVGEEAIETVIASKNEDLKSFENEAADLLFHLILLLKFKKTSLSHVTQLLKLRHLSRLC